MNHAQVQVTGFREKLLQLLGFMMMIVITIITIMILAGWQIKFIEPDYCQGSRTIAVGKANSLWEIAQREFPKSDPRAVTDELVRLNGSAMLDASSVKAPISCKN